MQKTLGILALVKAMLDGMRYQRFLSGIGVTSGLVIVFLALANVFVAGLSYAAFTLLMRNGLDADAAFIITGLCLMTVMAVFGRLIVTRIRWMRRAGYPLISSIRKVADAFKEGWLESPSESPDRLKEQVLWN